MRPDTENAFLAVETTQDATVVRFIESAVVLDGVNVPRMAELLGSLVEELRQERLILDFGNVRYISSYGLGALVSLHKQARAAGKRLTIRGACQEVYEPFEITRLTRLLDIRPREADGQSPAGS
jgi:anti-sigma B factor antagonist